MFEYVEGGALQHSLSIQSSSNLFQFLSNLPSLNLHFLSDISSKFPSLMTTFHLKDVRM